MRDRSGATLARALARAGQKNCCAVQQPTITVGDRKAPLEVRRHPKARRMTLRVNRARGAVVVTLPPRCDLSQADRFISRHLDWLKERLESLPGHIPFSEGAVVPLRGELHVLVFSNTAESGLVRLEAAGETLPRIVVSNVRGLAPRRLERWLMAEARNDIAARVDFHARRLGVKPASLVIRDPISRWGSCSSNGALSFSWRLILAPAEVLDYVAAHEVGHMREMNHGPRFWSIVEDLVPDYRSSKGWLSERGLDLHRYGPVR